MGKIFSYKGRRGTTYGIDYYVDGRRIRRIIGPDREVAKLELKKAEGRAASGLGSGPYGARKIRFRDFASEYLEYQRAVVSPNSARRYHTALKVLVLAFGDRHLPALRLADIEKYKAARSRAVGPWTVAAEIGVLKHMLNLAVKWGYLASNPANQVKKPKLEHRLRFLSEAEIHLLLAFCDQEIRPIVSLALLTGMRLSEVLGLTYSQIQLKERAIRLPNTKSGEPQTVHLNDTVLDEIRHLPPGKGEQRVFSIHPRVLNERFRKACQKAGIKNFRFHDLRHTFCSRLVMLGANLRAVQALARHKSISMTMRYAHLRDEYLAETVRLLNGEVGQKLVRNFDVGNATS